MSDNEVYTRMIVEHENGTVTYLMSDGTSHTYTAEEAHAALQDAERE